MGSTHYSDGSLVGSICPSESGSGLPWLEPDIKRHICCFWMNPVLLLTRTPLPRWRVRLVMQAGRVERTEGFSRASRTEDNLMEGANPVR